MHVNSVTCRSRIGTLVPSPWKSADRQTADSLPNFLLALPAGALADIVDRRRLLLFKQGLDGNFAGSDLGKDFFFGHGWTPDK